ncbi:efflux RND transporter periplasmic adaptor subunit [Vibrio superstes]|uniref:Acriflavin resistance protein n=1 Tax=Vibrio superstes NBRC 103154 TaxID=1219062 RepID=A0A511QSF6_9VIBR|nr:efflux RND transporter periplasmic adaptor subunit [Vibrio superstes]GEM80285.1 acriflavin resistance protein [Vibrio superstes NBRC 103154]
MKNFPKGLLITLLTLSIAGCYQATSNEPALEMTKPVKIVRYEANPSSTPFQFLGEVSATQTTPISFRLGGEVIDIHVEMGQQVNKGQLLATLDKTDYQLQLQSKTAEFDLAKSQYLRAKRMAKQKLISKDAFEQTLTRYQSAQAELEQAQTDLSYTEIHAPFSGEISLRFVQPYQLVAPQQPIFNLVDTSSYEVVVAVPVTTAHKLMGREYSLSFELDGVPDKPMQAKIKEVSSQPDKDTNSYQVTTEIFDQNVPLLPGSSGRLTVHFPAESLDHTHISESAWITIETDQQHAKGELWVFDEETSRVEKREILIDKTTGELSGLKDGEFIVESGVHSLVEAQRVRPWTRERGI